MGDDQWSVVGRQRCLLGQALQGAYADLQDDFLLPLIFPAFFSVSALSPASCISRL